MKSLVKNIKSLFVSNAQKSAEQDPLDSAQVIARPDHCISRQYISKNALKVLYKLHGAGFSAFLVGGGVRDLLLGREPKDFDITTDARPEQVRKIFRNCRLIGKRFRLAHVYFKDEIIEVATFRAQNEAQDTERSRHGLILRDNVYGNLDDDVWRRDFTVNALYYNIADFSVIDFTNAMQDIEHGVIRIIGDPEERYREDPVRILRAVRFAAKLGFKIDPETEAPFAEISPLIGHISNARLFDESLKLFLSGYGAETFAMLRHYNLFHLLFPLTEASLNDPDRHILAESLIMRSLENTDQRIDDGKPVTPAFLFAAMLWHPLQMMTKELQAQGLKLFHAFDKAMHQVIVNQTKHIAIPRRFIAVMREIWALQHQLSKRSGRRAFKLLHQAKFRAAYDFLLIRSESEPQLKSLAIWWTDFQAANDDERHQMVEKLTKPKRRKNRRRNNRAHSKSE